MSICYETDQGTEVQSDGRGVQVFVRGRCLLTFESNTPDEDAYKLVQILTGMNHGTDFDRTN